MNITEKDIEYIARGRWSKIYGKRFIIIAIVSFVLVITANELLIRFTEVGNWSYFATFIVLLLIFVCAYLITPREHDLRIQLLDEYRKQKGVIIGEYKNE